MISYGLTTLVLYAVSIGLYLLIQGGLTPVWRRRILHLSLASSLLIPLLLPYEAPRALPMGVSLFEQIPVQHLQTFCQCEVPQLGHRVFFRTYAIGSWLVHAVPWWLLFSGLLVGNWLIGFIRAVIRLHRLVITSKKTKLPSGLWRLIPRTHTPTSACWWGRPCITLGTETQGLSDEEMEAIIAHERSHLNQGNTLEQILYQLVAMLWFWNPLIWWAKRHLMWLSECQADDAASARIGSQAYARLLMKLHAPNAAPDGALTQGVSTRIYRRIHRLISPPYSDTRRKMAPIARPVLILVCQLLLIEPVQAGVAQTLVTYRAYEQQESLPVAEEEVLYCPDCETICLPEEGGGIFEKFSAGCFANIPGTSTFAIHIWKTLFRLKQFSILKST